MITNRSPLNQESKKDLKPTQRDIDTSNTANEKMDEGLDKSFWDRYEKGEKLPEVVVNAAPKMVTPLYKKMTCWKGYVAKGKKKSPSGKRTKGGKIKMVNNCVKK